MVDGGFGNPKNVAVLRMREYNGFLHAGMTNLGGCELWRLGEGGWEETLCPSVGRGLGNSRNIAVTVMEVHEMKLYVGTL